MVSLRALLSKASAVTDSKTTNIAKANIFENDCKSNAILFYIS